MSNVAALNEHCLRTTYRAARSSFPRSSPHSATHRPCAGRSRAIYPRNSWTGFRLMYGNVARLLTFPVSFGACLRRIAGTRPQIRTSYAARQRGMGLSGSPSPISHVSRPPRACFAMQSCRQVMGDTQLARTSHTPAVASPGSNKGTQTKPRRCGDKWPCVVLPTFSQSGAKIVEVAYFVTPLHLYIETTIFYTA
ncbi:hypothetical protein CALCODRAFT_108015 [Calocera cornea HHB12733]|uniref:Uncharacterized protein n=1 Tax=Calocera cornea HHB12733 TaxID=1353952 RepID=A0A165IGL2_9BASI|nr:hypothetical protein CALCODRAFT_108015 [Calocera cornea HHB12733]